MEWNGYQVLGFRFQLVIRLIILYYKMPTACTLAKPLEISHKYTRHNNRKELYIQYGVLVEDIIPKKQDVDFHHNSGSLSVVEYNSELGKCIEWHQCDVSIESHDQEWAIVQDISNNMEDNTQNSKKPIIQMKVNSIMEIIKKNQKLSVAGEEMKITFYFQHGSTDSFINFLRGILKTSMHQRTANSYVVTNKKEVQVLEKSFSELNLFTDDHTRSTVLWSFMKRLHESPYETTMETIRQEIVTVYRPHFPPEEEEEEVADMLNKSFSADESTDGNSKMQSDDYELVTKGPPLPPRTIPPRGHPLTEEQWAFFKDSSGRILEPDLVQEAIFRGGISPNGGLRKEVWKYLLGYYPWDSTTQERETIRMEKSQEYFRTKLQWQLMSDGQAERFGAYKMRMSLIEKDVHRTDRNLEYFTGDDNPHLILLRDILMTYVMYNFDLGYVQGMSDLLSPLLVQLEDEVDTFWCFVGFMNKVSRNFELDQEGMKEQLQYLYCLLCAVEPELANSLDQDSKNMSFCFRWLLVWFKREFDYDDIYLMWEVLWTEYLCKNYHLLVCIAILDNEKETLMSNNYGFTEVLKHINELANTMNVEQILRKAEGIYLQISSAVYIAPNVREIVGLPPLPQPENEESKQDADKEKIYQENTQSTKSTFDDVNELVFDQSLSMQYL